jgi:phosphate starvation-inducible PhoH-like protein
MLFSCLFFSIIIVSSKKNFGMASKIVKPCIKSKTSNQQIYHDQLLNNDMKIVLGMGPAGTGKTFVACHTAIEQLKSRQIEKIIITRPIISVEENMGFLPGSINEKMVPFTRPIFDVLSSAYDKTEVQSLIKKNIIEISPLGFMRGRTFDNAFIIADEMQNSTPNQMKMLLTRIGENSKLVITGDLEQSDYGYNNGLRDFFERISGEKWKNISWTFFASNDIQRSEIVKTIIKIYGK